MDEESKKTSKKEPAEEVELSNQDLEQVAGGASTTVNLTPHKIADKTAL